MRRFVVAIFIFIASLGIKAECISAEGGAVSISGIISKVAYVGPPNYESIADGDVAETHWVITTPESLCIAGETQGVSEFQLIFVSDVRFKVVEGVRYTVNGVTSMGVTGHHHTPILIEVFSLVRSR